MTTLEGTGGVWSESVSCVPWVATWRWRAADCWPHWSSTARMQVRQHYRDKRPYWVIEHCKGCNSCVCVFGHVPDCLTACGLACGPQVVDAKSAGFLSTVATVLNVVEVCDGSKWLVQLLQSDHPTMINEGLLAISVVCSHVKMGGRVGIDKLQGTSVVEDVLRLLSGAEESASQEMLYNALALVLHLCQHGEWEGKGD